MATQAEILLRDAEQMIHTLKKSQHFISSIDSSMAFELWKIERDLTVFNTLTSQIKEEYGTSNKES
jgi:hypothetical protein